MIKKALSNFYQSTLVYLNHYKNAFNFFSSNIRMIGKSWNFRDKKINESNFNKSKRLFKININVG